MHENQREEQTVCRERAVLTETGGIQTNVDEGVDEGEVQPGKPERQETPEYSEGATFSPLTV